MTITKIVNGSTYSVEEYTAGRVFVEIVDDDVLGYIRGEIKIYSEGTLFDVQVRTDGNTYKIIFE